MQYVTAILKAASRQQATAIAAERVDRRFSSEMARLEMFQAHGQASSIRPSCLP